MVCCYNRKTAGRVPAPVIFRPAGTPIVYPFHTHLAQQIFSSLASSLNNFRFEQHTRMAVAKL